MTFPTPGPFDGRRIVVCDQDPKARALITGTLRAAGHAVVRAYDGFAAAQLACVIDDVALLIANARAPALDGVALVRAVRERLPELPVLYVARAGRYSRELERRLPPDVPVLRRPFGGEELLAAVRPLLARPSRLPRGRHPMEVGA